MATGVLPADGELRLRSVALPAGRQIACLCSGDPVAWATIQDVPDVGRVWAALCDARQQTGLLPFLLAGLDDTATRPWDSGEFEPLADTAELDHIDAADVLKERWDGEMYEVDDPGQPKTGNSWRTSRLRSRRSRASSPAWPASGQQLDPGHLSDGLGSLPAGRIRLVPATRPADVLPLIGWMASDQFADVLPVAAVLRSWEDRFGARLVEVGFDEIQLLVQRPPRSLDAAQRVAAERWASADECDEIARSCVAEITARLLNHPLVWQLWWD
jgi:Domain of unknown function (DUF4253)